MVVWESAEMRNVGGGGGGEPCSLGGMNIWGEREKSRLGSFP